MENRKMGVILMALGLIVLGAFLYVNSSLINQAQELGCYSKPNCLPVERNFSFVHIGIGVFSFLLSLGIYLFFFSKSEQILLSNIQAEKKSKLEIIKFESFLKGLDPFEQRVVKFIYEQPGITQSHLQIKAEMSKAKLSYVLQDLEKRSIVKRIKKGKTLAVYLKV